MKRKNKSKERNNEKHKEETACAGLHRLNADGSARGLHAESRSRRGATQANTEPAVEATAVEPVAEDVYAISGTVSIAYPEGEVAEIQPVLDAFRAQYPNVTVEEVPFAGSTGGAFNEFLTQRAAANDMPDVMWLDWNDFAPEVASGFVMPLNDLMAGDPDAAFVPAGMTDPYTYHGKLYALPCQMNAMGMTINLECSDALTSTSPL